MKDEDTPDTNAKLNVNGVDIPPRGDLVQALADMIECRMKPQIVGVPDPLTGTMASVILRPDGTALPLPANTFDDYLDRPRRRQGTAVLTSIDSFIAHTNRFKDEESAVFVSDDRTKPSLTTVLDYHPANVEITGEGETQIGAPPPRFGRHRSLFNFPLSDEWRAWNAQNKKEMDIGAFAAFLEDRIADVETYGDVPLSQDSEVYIERIGGRDRIATPTDLVTLSKGLRINENASITDERRLASGEANIQFSTEHTDANGAKIVIQTSFILAIPVFRNDGLYGVVARLRYRVKGGLIVFWYELHATDRVFDHALATAAQKVGSETGLPVLYGAPE